MKKKISLLLVFMLVLSVIPNITAAAQTDRYTIENYYGNVDGNVYLYMNDSGTNLYASVKVGTGGWNVHTAGRLRYNVIGENFKNSKFSSDSANASKSLTTRYHFENARLYWAFNKSLYGESYTYNSSCSVVENSNDNTRPMLVVIYGY